MAGLEELAAYLLGDATQKTIAAENPYYNLKQAPDAVTSALISNVSKNPTGTSTKEALAWGLGSGLLSGLLGGQGDQYQQTLTDRYANTVMGKAGTAEDAQLPPGLFGSANRAKELWKLQSGLEDAKVKRESNAKMISELVSDPAKLATLREVAPEIAAQIGLGEAPIAQATATPEAATPQQKPGIIQSAVGAVRDMFSPPQAGPAQVTQPQAPTKTPSLINPVTKTKEDAIDNLRKEFNTLPEVKNFAIIQSKAAPLSKALSDLGKVSDQELVRYSLLMIEPTSVVRDGEAAAMAASQSIPEEWKGAMAAALNGSTTLGPEARQGIKRLAMRAYDGHRELYNRAVQFYGKEAKSKGLDSNRVSIYGEAQPAESLFGKADEIVPPDPKTFPPGTTWTGKVDANGNYVMRKTK